MAIHQFERWPEGLRIFNANFVTLGIGASRKFAGEWTSFVAISTGNQGNGGGKPSGDRRQLGRRVGADAAIPGASAADGKWRPGSEGNLIGLSRPT